jgi:hypothetical protein
MQYIAPYQPFFEEDLFEEEFKQFEHYVLATHYCELLTEFDIPKEILKRIEFIKELAIAVKCKVKDLLKLFLNKVVYKLFADASWSFKGIYQFLKNGYNVYCELQEVISKYIADKKIIKWTTQEVKKLDDYLTRHPNIKKISNVAISALIVFMWLASVLSSNVSDIDISYVWKALLGSISIKSLLTAHSGIKLLGLFTVGGLTTLAFPWVGLSILGFSIDIILIISRAVDFKLDCSTSNIVESIQYYCSYFSS